MPFSKENPKFCGQCGLILFRQSSTQKWNIYTSEPIALLVCKTEGHDVWEWEPDNSDNGYWYKVR